MAITVECTIRTSMDAIWDRTQDPRQHVRWDLRFTEIDYLPREDVEAPQKFRYATRLGFGIGVEGWGETAGKKIGGGSRATALKFGSDQSWSLIREGSGFWKYEPVADGVKFSTGYDYRPRFGALGPIVDRLFRPVMAWATAWSFDSLRIWLEDGIPPAHQRRMALAHLVARSTLAIAWTYHGLVPKLLFPLTGERELLQAAGMPIALQPWIGVAEIALGLATFAFWRSRSLVLGQAILIVSLSFGVLTSPGELAKPFNPFTLNLSLLSLALTAALCGEGLPSARNCRWSIR